MTASTDASVAALPEQPGGPLAIARKALLHLAALRLPPTPDHYARVYQEIAGRDQRSSGGPLLALRQIAADLAEGSPHTARAGKAMHHALDGGDWVAVREAVVKQCNTPAEIPTPVTTSLRARPPSRGNEGADWQQVTESCRALLADALVAYVAPDLGFTPDLVQEAATLAAEVRVAPAAADLQSLAGKLRALLVRTSRAGEEVKAIQEGLLRLLHLLSANVSELHGEGGWMRGQIDAVAALARGQITMKAITDLEMGLRDIAMRQGALKQSLDHAKDAMKQMVATFIERIGELAANAGGYHDRLAVYCGDIERASDIGELSGLVVRIMEDTRGVQVDLGRSREELLAARRTVEQFQERTARLESELVMLSDRLQEDQLTRVPNRRGLSRAYATEAARADRHHRPISLAMLDVDNFKALNDRLGHQAGDSALVHLAATIRASLRASDVIARYGGEEFIALLPETNIEQAMSVLRRVQHDLARNPFKYAGEDVPITFSAGVAERVDGETEEAIIARADRALYEAKTDGKNRVVPR
ncbi:MAG: GGDEF domain-containing protein [Casimicrobiaceae bacterium]